MGQGGHEKPEKSPMRTEASTYHQVRRIRGVPGQRGKAVDMGWGDRSRTSNTSVDIDIEPAEYVIGPERISAIHEVKTRILDAQKTFAVRPRRDARE